jgi:hypothetical protein
MSINIISNLRGVISDNILNEETKYIDINIRDNVWNNILNNVRGNVEVNVWSTIYYKLPLIGNKNIKATHKQLEDAYELLEINYE